ncbi:MAG: type IV secretion system protein [Candidatus Binataceae bacterium]|nr:type IV secretion system protein [Candidatus Binataceae bacterium]
MSVGLPSTILSVTQNTTADFVSGVFGPIANAVSAPLWAAVTLFVVVYGYMVMTGHIQQLYKTALRNILLVGFVTYTALNWDWFSYLYDVFTKSPDLFGSALSLGHDANSSLDELYDRGMDTAFSIWSRSGWDLALWGLGVAVFVVTLCLTGFTVFLLLLVKLLVAATLALGPIFIAFCLFDATRHWFRNWIGSLVTLVVFQLLLYASLGMGYAIYRAVVPPGDLYTASSADPAQVQGRVLPLLLIFLSLLFVLRKADSHAQALIGSMSYVGDALGHVMGSTKRALGAAARRGPRLRMRRT